MRHYDITRCLCAAERLGLCRVALAACISMMLARRARRRNAIKRAARHVGTNPWLASTSGCCRVDSAVESFVAVCRVSQAVSPPSPARQDSENRNRFLAIVFALADPLLASIRTLILEAL